MTPEASPSLDAAKGIYRGWYIAGVSALSIGAVLGTAQFAFSLFILPLEEEFGWSRTQVNGALTCGVVSGLLAPSIGNLMDRVGAKWTMTGWYGNACIRTRYLSNRASVRGLPNGTDPEEAPMVKVISDPGVEADPCTDIGVWLDRRRCRADVAGVIEDEKLLPPGLSARLHELYPQHSALL